MEELAPVEYTPWVINVGGRSVDGLYVIFAVIAILCLVIAYLTFVQNPTSVFKSCDDTCHSNSMMTYGYNETERVCYCLDKGNQKVEVWRR